MATDKTLTAAKTPRRRKPAAEAVTAFVFSPELDRIIFPKLSISRVLEDGLVMQLPKAAELETTMNFGVMVVEGADSGVSTVIKTNIAARSQAAKSGDHVFDADVHCLAYFKHGKGVTFSSVQQHVAEHQEEIVRTLSAQIYPAVILELQRVVSQAGLGKVPLSLHMPPFGSADKS